MNNRHALGALYRSKHSGQKFVITANRDNDDITLTPVSRPVQQPDTRFLGESFPLGQMRAEWLDGDEWTYLGEGSVDDAWEGWREP